MITNCTYSSLVVTIAIIISVSVTFTKPIQTCEIVQKITPLKQHLELGEVERNIRNEKEVRQCDWMMYLKAT